MSSQNLEPLKQNNNNWHFVAVGDWGSSWVTNNTVSNITSKIRNLKFVIGLGDYSYYPEDKECVTILDWWNKIMKPFHGMFRASLGDHDVQFSQLYKKLFNLKNWTYSFDYEKIHFISIDTNELKSVGSFEYNFIKADLEKAQTDPEVKWIIVYMHEPMYTAKSPSGQTPKIGMDYNQRFILHPLFDDYEKIAIVLAGHQHNYQRSYPLEYNQERLSTYPFARLESPTITDTNKYLYVNPKGQIYVVVGTGGMSIYQNDDNPAYVVNQEASYGFLDVEVSHDGNILFGKFYPNNSSNQAMYSDLFVIKK